MSRMCRTQPTQSTVEDLAKLTENISHRQVTEIMNRLAGKKPGGPPASLDECLQAMNRWVLVMSGVRTSEFWRATEVDDPQATQHQSVLCVGCNDFSLHGACRHGYACMLRCGIVSSSMPWETNETSTRARRRAKSRVVLAPGSGTSIQAQAAAGDAAEACADALTPLWKETRAFLRASGLEQFFNDLYREDMNIETLRAWNRGVYELKQCLGIKTGDANQLLTAIEKAQQERICLRTVMHEQKRHLE